MVQMRSRGAPVQPAEPGRRDPELHWMPLLVFGLLVLAQAPDLVRTYRLATGPDTPALSGAGTPWLLVLLCGSVLTAAWFGWLRRSAHVTAPYRAAVLVWTLGALLVWLLGWAPLAEILPAQAEAQVQQDGGLIVIGLGFLALAYEQRSRSLAWASGLIVAVSVLCTFWSPEALLYDLMGRLGTAQADLPLASGAAAPALLPALTLLGAAALAWRQSVRCRI